MGMKEITVFIVEDDPMVLDVNKGFLDRMPGYALVGESLSGKDALQHIKKIRPNLVLLDMYLPDVSGLDILMELRSERVPCDIIMITAARDAVTIQEVVRLGAVDYIVKPFRFGRFQKALDDYEKMVKKIKGLEQLKQEDIDEWIGSSEEEPELPKGLNELTMKQIMLGLVAEGKPVTAEQLASSVGMARVTVRKYLDFLVYKEKSSIEMQYGSVGRPANYYSLK